MDRHTILTDEPGRIYKLTGPRSVSDPHQTAPEGSAKTDDVAPSVAAGGRTPGREVETPPPSPSRPGVTPTVDPTDRVTSTAPFAVDRTITGDGIHLVTVALTDDAARQLARDLMQHMADLVVLSRLRSLARFARRSGLTDTAADVEHDAINVEQRIAGAMTAHMTTQWELTLTQAEGLLDELEEAATDPELCAVGTCTGYAVVGGYCTGHAEGV